MRCQSMWTTLDAPTAIQLLPASAWHMRTNHRKTSRPKKPPFTYTELIEYALEDKGELTVSGIYQWIS